MRAREVPGRAALYRSIRRFSGILTENVEIRFSATTTERGGSLNRMDRNAAARHSRAEAAECRCKLVTPATIPTVANHVTTATVEPTEQGTDVPRSPELDLRRPLA